MDTVRVELGKMPGSYIQCAVTDMFVVLTPVVFWCLACLL